jgi:hypothetical protein
MPLIASPGTSVASVSWSKSGSTGCRVEPSTRLGSLRRGARRAPIGPGHANAVAVRTVLLCHGRVRVLCGVHRSTDLVSRDNPTAALRGQLRQGGLLVLRLGPFCQNRRHLVLAGGIWLFTGCSFLQRRNSSAQEATSVECLAAGLLGTIHSNLAWTDQSDPRAQGRIRLKIDCVELSPRVGARHGLLRKQI